LNCSPVTVLRSQIDLPTISAFSCASVSATPPFFTTSATVTRGDAPALRARRNQIGEAQARSCGRATTSGSDPEPCA
jgi:hypothetical protein